MSLSAAQICNIALARVGERQFIADLEENNPRAALCRVFYANTRDMILGSLWWPFATARATLAVSTAEVSGWDYTYALPTDLLAARFIYPGTMHPTKAELLPFAIEYSGGARILVTNEEDVELVYTAKVGDTPTLFSPHFVNALAWALAADLALSLAVKPQVGLAMQAGAKAALLEAGAFDGNQAEAGVVPDSEIITGR